MGRPSNGRSACLADRALPHHHDRTFRGQDTAARSKEHHGLPRTAPPGTAHRDPVAERGLRPPRRPARQRQVPDPDPTGERGPDADVELAGDCVETTALGVVRIDGELFVGVAERFPGPDAQQQAKRLLACRNRHAERYGLTPYTHKDLDPWELDG